MTRTETARKPVVVSAPPGAPGNLTHVWELPRRILTGEPIRMNTIARTSFSPPRAALGLLMAVMLLALAGYGQSARGLITGVITDNSGAVVPGAAVRAVNLATNLTTAAVSNERGNYTLDLLQPGDYRITFTNAGFKTVEQSVTVRADDRLTLDAVFQVGAVSERLIVEGSAPILETASSSLGTVIDNRRIQDLPLIQGNPFMLELLTPGITFSGNSAWSRPFDNEAGQASVNGSSAGSIAFQLDGVADNWGGLPAYTPSVEFIQEYKVQTAGYDAAQGHSSGAWVDVALKSGTNRFHGAVYDYLQNPSLNSNLFFNNKAGQPKPDYKFNRPGGDIGGPIRKDRTFFFFGYERIRHNSPYPQTYTVPTPAERSGDFSALLALGNQYQVYDPATTKALGNGRYGRDPFPGNRIPASRLNGIAQKIVNYYPQPNQPGSSDGGTNFNFGRGIEPDKYYTFATRFDHAISDAQRIFGRVVYSKRVDGPYRDWAPDASGTNLNFSNRGAAVDYINTLNPQTVLNLRYGYTRFFAKHELATSGFDITTLGLPSSLKSQITTQGYVFPTISPANFSGLDTETADGNFADIHTFYGSVSRTVRQHLVRVGADFRVYLVNNYNLGASAGKYIFGSTYTNGPIDNSAGAPRGQDLASLLLGIPTGGYVDVNGSFAARTRWAGIFVQDDWKVSRKLTLNLGLRYEYEGPIQERYNRSVRGFDFNSPSPIAAQAQTNYAVAPIPQIAPSQFQVKGGLLYAGVNGTPSGLYEPLTREFAPRFGLAYSLNSNTVIRGGYGIFYDQVGITRQSPIQSGFSQQTALVSSVDNGLTFQASLANPFPQGLQTPPGSSQGLASFLGKNVSFVNPQPSAPYAQRWSIGIQHQFGKGTVIDLGYVGNRGTDLLTATSLTSKGVLNGAGRQLDGIPNQYLSKSLTRDQATIDRLTSNVPNPFYPLLPGTNLSGTTVPVSQLLLPYPQFTSVTMLPSDGFNWYHALQMQVQRRMAKGFTVMGSWTWSKNMEAMEYLNAMDTRPSRSISASDRTQRVVINGIYELPFGKGKLIGTNASGVANRLLSGWQISAMFTRQSGAPLGFGNYAFTGDATAIALSGDQRSPDHWFNTSGFLRNVGEQLANNVRYTSLRYSGVRGDGIAYLDGSLIKTTKIAERFTADFRAEFFNALNHPVFSDPDTNPTSSTFGRVTDSAQTPRTIQFGFVFRF